MNKKGQKTTEKMFQPAFGCFKHLKAGRNTQQAPNPLSRPSKQNFKDLEGQVPFTPPPPHPPVDAHASP